MCSKVLSFMVNSDQCFWRDELISGCIGVLFDLDENHILQKDKELIYPEPGLECNWKGLVVSGEKAEYIFQVHFLKAFLRCSPI